jgi:O-glycosyl hydrolase
MATAWTPPASMKTNNNVAGGELKTRHVLIFKFATVLIRYSQVQNLRGVKGPIEKFSKA